MKKLILISAISFLFLSFSYAQEYKVEEYPQAITGSWILSKRITTYKNKKDEVIKGADMDLKTIIIFDGRKHYFESDCSILRLDKDSGCIIVCYSIIEDTLKTNNCEEDLYNVITFFRKQIDYLSDKNLVLIEYNQNENADIIKIEEIYAKIP